MGEHQPEGDPGGIQPEYPRQRLPVQRKLRAVPFGGGGKIRLPADLVALEAVLREVLFFNISWFDEQLDTF